MIVIQSDASTIYRLQPILISRFLLNLRDIGEAENETQGDFNSGYSVAGFRIPSLANMLGNMGQELDYGPLRALDDSVDDDIVGSSIPAEEIEMPAELMQLSREGFSLNCDLEIQEVCCH